MRLITSIWKPARAIATLRAFRAFRPIAGSSSPVQMLERFESGSMTACPVPRSGLAFRMGQKIDRYGQGQLGGVRARPRRRVDGNTARRGNVGGARPPREYWRNGNRRRSPRQRGAASRGEDGTNCAAEGLFVTMLNVFRLEGSSPISAVIRLIN